MQNEITTPQKLLGANGSIINPGWSRTMLQQYSRADIKASGWRVKEWDYYTVSNGRNVVCLTIADLTYMGLVTASYLDLHKPAGKSVAVMPLFPRGKMGLSENSDNSDVHYKNRRIKMDFVKKGEIRHLSCHVNNFDAGMEFQCEIQLEQPPMDTIVIATTWKENPHAFYFNQKINCMKASGYAQLGSDICTFENTKHFGTLDWGRGVWTYDNTWYWGSGNAWVHGKPFGFNIGYGFGDTSAASENILFYDGECHKIEQVDFHIPPDDYMKPWTFSSSDSRFEMDFVPMYDRIDNTNAGIISTLAHQVFGKYSGKAVLDDGTVLEIHDLTGFAEKVRNRY